MIGDGVMNGLAFAARRAGQLGFACLMLSCLVAVWSTVAAEAADPLPDDVTAFIANRTQCDHFRGEESDDPARQSEIKAGLDQYCKGTDAALHALKDKYKNGPQAAIDALGVYQEDIE